MSMLDGDGDYAEVVSFEVGCDAVALAAKESQHYLVFIPPSLVSQWPSLQDLGEDYVVWLDRGDGDALLVVEGRAWPTMQLLLSLGPVVLQGVIFIPKSTPRGAVFTALDQDETPPEDVRADLIMASFGDRDEAGRIRVNPMVLHAVRAVDPDAALDFQAAMHISSDDGS